MWADFLPATTPVFTLAGPFQTANGGGAYDAFLAKYSATGNIVWATYYGGNGYDQGTCVAIDSMGGSVYLTGYTNSTSGITSLGASVWHSSVSGGTMAFL